MSKNKSKITPRKQSKDTCGETQKGKSTTSDQTARPPMLALMELARLFLASNFKYEDNYTLRYVAGNYWCWERGCYQILDEDCVQDLVLTFLSTRDPQTTPSKAEQVVKCVRSLVSTFCSEAPPTWLGESDGPADIGDWIVFSNGILDVRKLAQSVRHPTLRPHTPLWFTSSAMPYAHAGAARCPMWLNFLDEVLDGDPERIALLQEYFGYCVTVDTSLQKALIMPGPRRAGKGTVIRVLMALVGKDNCAAPSLVGLASAFGLANLVGKSLAFCTDIHLSKGHTGITALEILKCIIGEDPIDVNEKYKPQRTCRLKVRFVLACNELPAFADPSNAMSERLLVLPYFNTYAGQEDTDLTSKLTSEVAGIFNWAIDGLKRLRANSRFTEPKASREIRNEMARTASPIGAFVEDECRVAVGKCVEVKILYKRYEKWCQREGFAPVSLAEFGSQLRTVVPRLQKTRPRGKDGIRVQKYQGIALA